MTQPRAQRLCSHEAASSTQPDASGIAVLLDGVFVQKRLLASLGGKAPTASDILAFASRCLTSDEELFRIYYHDCPPFGGVLTHPMSGEEEDYSKTPVFAARTRLLDDLAHADHVAFRQGVLSATGWRLRQKAQQALMRAPRSCGASDFEPAFKQKRVDMKIGPDVAWLSSKRIVERIVLVTADTDFVPAMESARREGVQVVLVPMGARTLNKALRAHADVVRTIA